MPKLSDEYLKQVAQTAQQSAATTTTQVQEKPSAIKEAGGRVLGGALKVLDYIERPYYGLMNAGLDVVDDDPNTNVLKSFWKGFSGQDKTQFGDITTELGWKPETTYGKIIKGGVDFVGGVLLDPTTYLTAGYGKGAMVIGRGMKPLSKAGVAIFEKEGAKQLGKKLTGSALKKELKRMSPEIYENVIRNTLKAIEKTGTPEKFFGQTAVRFVGKTIPGSTKVVPAVSRALKPLLNSSVAGRKISIATGKTAEKLGDLFVPGYNIRHSKNLTLSQKFELLNRADSYRVAREVAKTNNIQDVVNKFRTFSRAEREQITYEIEKFLPKPIFNKTGTKVIDFEKSGAKLTDIKDEKIRTMVGGLKDQLNDLWQQEVKAGIRDPEKIIEEGYIKRITRGFVDKQPVTAGSLKPRKEAVPTVEQSKEAFKKAQQSWYFEADSAKWLAARMTESDHLVMKKELIDYLDTNNFIKKIGSAPVFDEAGAKVVGFKKDAKKIAELKQKGFEVFDYGGKEYMVLPEVAKEFKLISEQYTSQNFKKFLTDIYDQALNTWKLSVTSLFPSFHSRNAVSNLYLAYLGGWKDPKLLKTAGDLQWYGRRLRNGLSVKDKTIKLGKEEWKMSELLQLASEHGILGSGWQGADFLRSPLIRPKFATGEAIKHPVESFNWAAGNFRKVGTAVENNARLTLFLDQIAKGKSVQEATLQTKKFLFDYGELTDFEKGFLKRVIPFYTWLRKNLPLQLEQVASQPGKYAGVMHFKDSVEQFTPDDEEKFLPDFMRTKEMYLRLPNDTYWRPDLPFQDLARAFDLRNWVSATSPLVKGLFEVTANRNFFTGKPIADEKLPQSKFKRELWKNWILDQMRTTSYWRKANDEDRSAFKFWLDFTLGINTYPFDVAQGKKQYKERKTREKQAELRFQKTQKKQQNTTGQTIRKLFGFE